MNYHYIPPVITVKQSALTIPHGLFGNSVGSSVFKDGATDGCLDVLVRLLFCYNTRSSLTRENIINIREKTPVDFYPIKNVGNVAVWIDTRLCLAPSNFGKGIINSHAKESGGILH